MCYKIITLTKEWVPSLAKLERSCFSEPWTESLFAGEFTHENVLYRGIVKHGELVSYMGMWLVADEGQITNVAVCPQHRRKGLAMWLIRDMAELGVQKGLQLLTLEVRAHNHAAISLYQKLGFEIVGRRPNYYAGKEDALLMNLQL